MVETPTVREGVDVHEVPQRAALSVAHIEAAHFSARRFALKRRRFDVIVCWRLDRLGRNLKHLITLLDELQSLGVAFVSLAEGIDATTPAGKLQIHILGAIAEFERARIQERVRAGLARARAQGVKLGRPRRWIDPERLAAVAGLPDREAARRLGIPRSTFQRLVAQKPLEMSR